MHVGMTNHTILAEEGGPLLMASAAGIYVTDLDGNRYIDGISGMYFRNAGHGRTEIAEAVYEQLKSVSMNVYSGTTPVTIRLAAKLAQITPGDLTRTFFCQGGSEANESSLKMAQAYHVRRGDAGRYKVISRRGSYHGSTYGTMWLGGHPGFPRTDYQPKPANVVTVGQPHYYHDTYGASSAEENGERAANEIEEAIIFEGPESISAVIGEPVSQPLGGVVPPSNYWPMVREICDKYGVLLIFDEVITGFGRLGEWFGADFVGVTPDIMSFAKGITSGYFPVGGSISTQKIADAFAGGPEKVWSHMYTYSAHPGGAAAAFANLEIVERENLVENARIRGEQISESLLDMKDQHVIIGDVRGVGLIQGI
ncbi:MAG TPA: aspartate aminotransferase family protein, partial [Dehalococcoidia bacterium]|nr:aspartate aminotransferase family protein [Dehalococcoidia bacterium]